MLTKIPKIHIYNLKILDARISSIKSAVTPTIPYVAPTKKKLLLYVARAVEKREHTQKQKTLVALLFSLVMTASRLTAAFKESPYCNVPHLADFLIY